MDRKIIMGVAAVAGIGLLLYMRKNSDASTIGASGALVGSGSGLSNWASSPIVITNTKAPVVDATAAAPVENIKPPVQTAVPPAQTTTFAIGGGPTNNPTKPGSGFFGAGGTEINDPTAVGRLNSVGAFIKTLDWSDANKASSAASLGDAARQYGVSQREIAIASGYRDEDIARLLEGQNVARY